MSKSNFLLNKTCPICHKQTDILLKLDDKIKVRKHGNTTPLRTIMSSLNIMDHTLSNKFEICKKCTATLVDGYIVIENLMKTSGFRQDKVGKEPKEEIGRAHV